MRKRFQMLVCAAAFTAAAGLCTLPLTAFAADAAVLLPDESAPVVEVVLEPLTPAAEEVPETTEPAEPDAPADADADPSDTPGQPATEPADSGIALLPAKDAETPVVVPTAAEDTVDIEVSWDAMEFTYTAAWNPSTLAYDPGSWTASGNTVTVTSNGTEATIAQSGLLQPGSALTRLNLDTEVDLPAGSYDGYFSLGFYDPASNEKATVDSHIDGLTIHVS